MISLITELPKIIERGKKEGLIVSRQFEKCMEEQLRKEK